MDPVTAGRARAGTPVARKNTEADSTGRTAAGARKAIGRQPAAAWAIRRLSGRCPAPVRDVSGPGVALDLRVRCPDCPPVREARELVLGDALWTNALYLILPLAITLLAAVLILRWIDRQPRGLP
jgi:hypothetical protein